MSTLIFWFAPPRAAPISVAASAAAAIELCAATPTANDDGSAVSSPVRVARDSAASGSCARCQRSCRACFDDVVMAAPHVNERLTGPQNGRTVASVKIDQ